MSKPKIILHAGNEIDISEPIPNMMDFTTTLKAKGSPELSDMVITLWGRSHAMRYYLMETDETESYERLLKMAKFLQPIFVEIVAQLGTINLTAPNDCVKASEALNNIIDEAPLEAE